MPRLDVDGELELLEKLIESRINSIEVARNKFPGTSIH